MTTLDGHLTDDLAQRLADGLADPAAAVGAEAHLSRCEACAALVESYRELAEALEDLPLPDLPADFTAAVLDRIEVAEAQGARERRFALGVLSAVLVVAAGAAVAGGAGGLAGAVAGWADGLGDASQLLRIGRGVLPGLLSALRLPLLVGAAAVALPVIFGLSRLMPAYRTETT